MSSAAPPAVPWIGNMKKKTIENHMIMMKEYLTPAVRVVDLHMDTSFCLSGSLDDTYDDPIEWED
jgi:hypothetical protein